MELSKYEYDHFDMVTYYRYLEDGGVELVTLYDTGVTQPGVWSSEPNRDVPVEAGEVPDKVLEAFSDD